MRNLPKETNWNRIRIVRTGTNITSCDFTCYAAPITVPKDVSIQVGGDSRPHSLSFQINPMESFAACPLQPCTPLNLLKIINNQAGSPVSPQILLCPSPPKPHSPMSHHCQHPPAMGTSGGQTSRPCPPWPPDRGPLRPLLLSPGRGVGNPVVFQVPVPF